MFSPKFTKFVKKSVFFFFTVPDLPVESLADHFQFYLERSLILRRR